MKNLSRSFFLIGVLLGTVLGFTTSSAGSAVVSLTVDSDNPPAVGEHLRVNIEVAGGKGISGYGMFFIFDTTALKYVEMLPGDYLPAGGIMIAPILTEKDTYAVKRDIEGSTVIDDQVSLGPDTISVDSVLSDVPDTIITEAGVPTGKYQWVSPFGSVSPDTASAVDGTLATLVFEVIAAKPISAALLDIELSDADDEKVEADIHNALITTQDGTITVSMLAAQGAAADVNGDGAINILDLTFVALHFGEPVTAANAAADVNGDTFINILDITLVAQQIN